VRQGRIGHSGNASLVAVNFSISHTKCKKRGLLDFFVGGMSQGPFDPSRPLMSSFFCNVPVAFIKPITVEVFWPHPTPANWSPFKKIFEVNFFFL
jgi:hypothetical protein